MYEDTSEFPIILCERATEPANATHVGCAASSLQSQLVAGKRSPVFSWGVSPAYSTTIPDCWIPEQVLPYCSLAKKEAPSLSSQLSSWTKSDTKLGTEHLKRTSLLRRTSSAGTLVAYVWCTAENQSKVVNENRQKEAG